MNYIIFLMFLGFPFSAFAEETELDSTQKKVSYIVGRNIGSDLRQDGIELEMQALLRGVQEAYTGKESQISEETARQVLTEFYGAIHKKRNEAAAAVAKEQLEKGQKFLAKNGKRKGVTTTESGLQYEVITTGTGKKPAESDYVIAHFHGTLMNETVFDSTVDQGVAGDFRVDQVIPGLSEALQLMPEGSKWKIFVPSDIGYGEQGSGEIIGPNEVLIYELELITIHNFKTKKPDQSAE